MKIPTEVRLCWDFFLGGAVVSTAPTEQVLHQPRRNAPFTWLVQQRLLHPLEVHQPRKNCTIYFVGAAETAAPPGSAPTEQALHQPR